MPSIPHSDILLLFRMSRMDIRKRYLGTLLGSAWAIISPLITTGLIYVVTIYGLKAGGAVGNASYVNWLISGMLAWFFVLEILSTGINAIVENSHLVTKIRFPLRLLVMVKVVSAMPIHILLMLILMLLMAVQGVGSFAYWLQLPYYFLCATILTLGINYLTSAAQVFTRDIGSVMGVILQALFWATPIFWRADLIANSKFGFLLYSPFAYIITGYRDSLFNGLPFWQRPVETVIFWITALFILFFGMLFFQRVRPHFADVL
ncbi:ABC transporter permease [Nostoc sphaeroides CHAB 2801]|uniref:ABC transporter permease n=2 Tax=Nostoc sphaeroides TaxID=446679 RepID=UPI000E4A42B0|nr:ABC transporter permease [Nostoc sphaeroides]MCC5629688.1 ABC transporter permease [Nostoc sphaeroides CHAB 2801]